MMNNVAKLGLAVFIAIAAGILNMVFLASRAKPTEYLALGDVALRAGERFPSQDGSYKKLLLPSSNASMNKSLVLYSDRAIVFGLAASRDFVSDDPIFFRDIADAVPQYETLGPFTLLSVGERLTGTVETDRSSRGASVITVEPIWEMKGDQFVTNEKGDRVYGEATRKLLQIVEAQRQSGERGAASHLKIVAIEPRPSVRNAKALSASANGTASLSNSPELIRQTERAIIVPVDRVATIPEVLQVGTGIAFVVPAYP